MRFKHAQVLDLLGISSDTLRHWKKALPPISAKDGRADDYAMAELLSLAIIARATHHLKVQVSLFTDFSTRLFEAVEEMVMAEEFDRVLVISEDAAGLVDPSRMPKANVLLIIGVRPIVEQLRARIGAGEESSSEPLLPFPQ